MFSLVIYDVCRATGIYITVFVQEKHLVFCDGIFKERSILEIHRTFFKMCGVGAYQRQSLSWREIFAVSVLERDIRCGVAFDNRR